LWGWIEQHFALEPDLEASIQVTPEFLCRIGFGIQDANPEVQRAVNRVVPVELLPLQRKVTAYDQPSQRERITMLEASNQWFTAHGYDAIGTDHYARAGRLLRHFQGNTTGRELEQRRRASGSRLV
jgi:coproporphyrinogen III oxidase-like Fe-S oxidoreductase